MEVGPAAPAAGAWGAVDHLVYAAPELEAAVRQLAGRLGVRAALGGRHPRWRTRNALLALGPAAYLEIVSPDTERADPRPPTIFGLDRSTRPRLSAWAVRASALERRVAAAARRGVELGGIQVGTRRRPDGHELSWRLTDPGVVLGDGLVPFLIDWGQSEHPAATAPSGCRLAGLRAEHPEPERVRPLLDALGVDLPLAAGPQPALIATLRTPRGEVELG